MRKFLLILAVALLLIGTAMATDGNLPGGTSISVDITAPSDGAVKSADPGIATLAGTAEVGKGEPVANTALIYVLDASGSTDQAGGCGGDQNGDGNLNFILDCEIAAAKALNQQAVTIGTVGDVGTAIFADTGAGGDVGPGPGDQAITGPDTNAGGTGGRDVEEVLASAFSDAGGGDGGFLQFTPKAVGQFTNFHDGLVAALGVAAQSSKDTKIIVFMSDGLNNAGDPVNTVVVPPGVVIHTFAIGASSSCTADPNSLGSLLDVARLSDPDGTCTPVPDIASLPDIVPAIITAKLLSLSYSVDGGVAVAIDNAFIDPDLPIEDPVSATFGGVDVPLSPGIYKICVQATGSDGGGKGSVEECIEVTIVTIDLTPAEASNELGTPGQQHTVTAMVAAGADGGVSGVPVDFDILSGPNAVASGSGSTDSDGKVTFTYTAAQGLAGIGQDKIEACYGPDEQGDSICDTATKDWVDTTPPVGTCPAGPNPAGKVPPAKGGQRPDGFYALTATDAVDPSPQIFLVDTGSGMEFGPFASVTNIKYTQAPGATPGQKPMSGVVSWHITGTGDAAVYAVDASGNEADPVACLVPPPPK